MPSFKIAVIGLGGIGSTFASHLAQAGHQVTVIARPGSPRAEQLQRDGAIVRTTGERVEVQVSGALDEQVAYDLVIVTTLAHQVDAVLPALRRSQSSWVQFMFNVFDPERLQAALGEGRCSFGMPFVQATVTREGKLDSRISPGQKTLHGDRRWAELFIAAGLPSAFEPNMTQWLRCHVPLGVAFESISVAGVRRGGGASWAEAMVVSRGMHAGFAILEARGHRLYPGAKAVLAALPVSVTALVFWLASRVRSFRELLATGLHECRALSDRLVAAAEQPPALPEAAAAVRAAKPTSE